MSIHEFYYSNINYYRLKGFNIRTFYIISLLHESLISIFFCFQFFSSWDSIEHPTKYQCGKINPHDFGEFILYLLNDYNDKLSKLAYTTWSVQASKTFLC